MSFPCTSLDFNGKYVVNTNCFGNDGAVYKQILIKAELKAGKRGKKDSWLGEVNWGDWEVRIGLYCHLREEKLEEEYYSFSMFSLCNWLPIANPHISCQLSRNVIPHLDFHANKPGSHVVSYASRKVVEWKCYMTEQKMNEYCNLRRSYTTSNNLNG